MKNFEKLIVFAVVMMPFTLLRIGFLGIGEIILILLFLHQLKDKLNNIRRNRFLFSKFWITFLGVSLIGFLYNLFVFNLELGTLEGMLFDSSAYIIIFLSCFTIENYHKNHSIDFYKILKGIFFFSGIIFTLLFILSLYRDEVFGMPLKYFVYFAPLATNLHQTSLFLVPLPFIGILIFTNETKKFIKFSSFLLIFMFVIIALNTGSFKGLIGIFIGGVVYIFFQTLNSFKGRKKKLIITLIISISVITFLYYLSDIFEALVRIFQEEDLEEGRSTLYSSGIEVGLKSPLVGLGPGPHIWEPPVFWDSHQTILTIFLQAGLVGVLIFVKFLYTLLKKIIAYPALLASFMPVLIYLLGGDIMRRLPTWIILVILFYYQTFYKSLKTNV